MPPPTTRCFLVRCAPVDCHVQVDLMPGQATKVRALPWVEDRLVIRPVLDEAGKSVEFVDGSEESVVANAVEFLSRRFGPVSTPPKPCSEVNEHIRVKTAPVRWTDRLD